MKKSTQMQRTVKYEQNELTNVACVIVFEYAPFKQISS